MNSKSWTSILFLTFFLAACFETNNASIELSGLNYTNTWISTFSVDGYGGHGISPNGGGGAFVCCVNIPRKWHAGMKVTVRWTEDERVPDLWKERVVDIPEYTKQDIGAFAVHFYPGEIVKVLVTSKTEGHPDYPYPRPN
jgi:hypothetical protein